MKEPAPPRAARLRRLTDEEIDLWIAVAKSVSRRKGAKLPSPRKIQPPAAVAAPPPPARQVAARQLDADELETLLKRARALIEIGPRSRLNTASNGNGGHWSNASQLVSTSRPIRSDRASTAS